MRGVEDYLGQIKRLEEDAQRCTTTILAQTLKVSLPSASEMLKRLVNEGYISRSKDGTISLTPEGRVLAHRVLRRHRVVERLLTDLLGLPWHEVHGEAHRLEHAISPRVEERLMQSLGFPEYCPHGHPICPIDQRELRPLDQVEVGEEVAIAQISEINEELLSYLDQIGVRPASIVKVSEVTPHGPMTLQTDAGMTSLGREVAALIQVCEPEDSDWISRRSVT